MGEKQCLLTLFILSVLGLATPASAENTLACSSWDAVGEKISDTVDNLYFDIKSDLCFYLEKNNLLVLGGVLLTAGILSNTGIDRSIHHFWQHSIRSKALTHALQLPCSMGDFHYPPVYYGSILLGGIFFDECKPCSPFTRLYEWGYRSIRTLYLAGAQKELFSWVIGNGRPNAHKSARWHPCKKKNRQGDKNSSGVGVSAHAFNGAIPFITAAIMTDEAIFKYGLYACSTLPGLSRVNDDHHYFSQVFLGWALSFLSAQAIDKTEKRCTYPIHFHAAPALGGGKVYASLTF